MDIHDERGTSRPSVGSKRTRPQVVALWLGVGAIVAHAVAWGAITLANALADSMFPVLFIPGALLAVALVLIGLGLGVTAIVVALRARPLVASGIFAIVLGAAGAVIAVITFLRMAG